MSTIPFLGVPQQQLRRLVPTSLADSPYWGDEPELWDDITINGLSGFGLVDLSVKKGQRVDSEQAPGGGPPEMTHMGFYPAEVTIRIRMWTQEHWDNWQALAKVFRWGNPPPALDSVPAIPIQQGPVTGGSVQGGQFVPGVVNATPPALGSSSSAGASTTPSKPKKGPDPVTVDHPALAAHGIRYIYILSVEPPRPSGVSGIFEATILASEWEPKPKQEVHGIIVATNPGTPIAKAPSVYGSLIKAAPPSAKGFNP